MLSIIFGLVAVTLGLSGVWLWHRDFMVVMKGLFPVSLLLAGIVAIIVGAANLTSPRRLPPPK
jgi:hypothetical protein